MAKDKRSFFEKLTGAVRLEDEPENKNQPSLSKEKGWIEEEAESEDGQLAVDVHQTPTEIILKTMVAGVKPEDLDINITRDMVTIRGKREGDRAVSDDNYFFRELYWGSFSRTILLPHEVIPDEAEAIEKHGLLIIKLPKVNKDRQTKLRVKTI